jgi:hypothetical protein
MRTIYDQLTMFEIQQAASRLICSYYATSPGRNVLSAMFNNISNVITNINFAYHHLPTAYIVTSS